MSDCPTTDRLRSLLDGKLAEAEQSELQRHIDECEACQRTLESLVAGKESWAGIARQLGDRTPVTPALQDVMAEAIGPTACDATMHSVKLPPGFLQPAQQPDSMGRLAHYEILQEVGSGGMGVVLKAFDTSLRRVVAIKVMAPHLAANAAARRRFVREAQAAAAVAHEHVVAIHAVADQHEPPYLAMQFIEGKTLQERIDQSGPLSVREVLRIGMQTAAGLAAAHAQGLVHRDIKPANILLENGVERVKLTDFGLARAVDDATVTQSGVIAGTPLFMSPEQARGESVDHRSDLFSLGSVLYAMCVGHAPFRASTTMGVIKRVCDESPRPIRELNPDVPEWLVKIIDKLLAKNPGDRIQSAQEVADLLGQCLAHLQQPQTIALPSELASMPAASSVSATHAAMARQNEFAIKALTFPVLGVFVLLLIGAAIGQMRWQEFLMASCVVGLWVMFIRWIIHARHAQVFAAAQQDESSKPDAMSSHSQMRSRRIRIGFTLGLVAGSLSIAWLIVINLQPISGPASAWWGFVGELGLWLVAGASLVTGILVGGRRFVRGLDTRNPGGRLWGTTISGLLLAIVSTGLLAVFGFVAVYSLSRSEPRIAPARLTYQLPGPHVAVTLNGEKVDVSPSGHIVLNLTPGEYVIAYIKNGRPEVRSGESLWAGEHKTVTLDESQADAVQITGPIIMSYGPGATAPNVADYIMLQGRWTIVSEERDGELVTAPQRGKWIEFDRGSMRWDAPDTPRYQIFPTESLVAIYAAVNPGQIDILNFRASGIYKRDGDRLTLAIADPDKPRPTEFVSRLGSGITLTVCQRAGGSITLPSLNGKPWDWKAAVLANAPLDLNGDWDSVWKRVAFTHELPKPGESSLDVKATYYEGGGTIEGTLNLATRTFEGRFRETNGMNGPIRLIVSPDGRTIMGRYAYRQRGTESDPTNLMNEWDMTRRDTPSKTAIKFPVAPIDAESTIAWGPTSPKGVQLGIQFDPRRTEYRIGEVIKLRLFLRNAGKTAMSTALPRLEVLEKFGFDLTLLDEQDQPLPWQWGPAHKSRELFTVSGAMEFPLRPGATNELPQANIAIGKTADSKSAIAVLDVPPHQICRLVCKLATYGYAKGEGEPLESSAIEFRVTAGDPDANANADKPNAQPIAKLLFDAAGVWNLTLSHNEKLLGAIGPNGDVGSKFKVWDAESLTERLTVTDERTIYDAVFLPDGERFVSSASDLRQNHIQIRELATGRVLHDFEPLPQDATLGLAVSGDGKTLISGGSDKVLRVWDLPTKQLRKSLEGATSPIRSVAISQDGSLAAVGCENGHIHIWDVATGETRHRWAHFTFNAVSIAFSPDNKHLAAASLKGLACLFDIGNDFPTKFLQGHTDEVRAIAWSPDGQRAATASSDGTAALWEAAKPNRRLATFDARADQCYDAVFLNENRLATAHRDGNVRVWNVAKSVDSAP